MQTRRNDFFAIGHRSGKNQRTAIIELRDLLKRRRLHQKIHWSAECDHLVRRDDCGLTIVAECADSYRHLSLSPRNEGASTAPPAATTSHESCISGRCISSALNCP